MCSASSSTCAAPYAGQPWVCGTVVWHAGQPSRMKATVRAMQLQPVPQVRAYRVRWDARQEEQPERNKGRVRGRLTTGWVMPVRWIWCGGFVLKQFWEKASCVFFFHCQLWRTCGRPPLHSHTHTRAYVQ